MPKSAEIEYSYSIAGKEYVGSNYAFLSAGTIVDRDEITSGYHIGETINVFWNRTDPSQSVVRRRHTRFEYIWLHLFLAAVCVGLVVHRQADIRSRAAAASLPSNTSLERTRER